MTPETDALVRNLRDFGEMPQEGDVHDVLIDVMGSMAHQAADTIERLTAQLAAREDVRLRRAVDGIDFEQLPDGRWVVSSGDREELACVILAHRALPPDPTPAASEREADRC